MDRSPSSGGVRRSPAARFHQQMIGWDFWSVISVLKIRFAQCATGNSNMTGDFDLGVSKQPFTPSESVGKNYESVLKSNFRSKSLAPK
mgnify:CR=1 FL=1